MYCLIGEFIKIIFFLKYKSNNIKNIVIFVKTKNKYLTVRMFSSFFFFLKYRDANLPFKSSIFCDEN